jgi:hypothetical protein
MTDARVTSAAVNHSGYGTVPEMTTSRDETLRPRPVDALFGGRLEALRTGTCRKCGEAVDPGEFMDAASRAEWNISALCANCQTVVFTTMGDDAR